MKVANEKAHRAKERSHKTHVTSEWKCAEADANEQSSRPTPNRSLPAAAAFSVDNFFGNNSKGFGSSLVE